MALANIPQMSETKIFTEFAEFHPLFDTEVFGDDHYSHHQVVDQDVEWKRAPFVLTEIKEGFL